MGNPDPQQSIHPPVPVVDVTPQERSELGIQAECVRSSPYLDFPAFEAEAAAIAKHLPDSVWQALVDFRRRGNESGAILLRGFPTDPKLPPTPANPEDPVAKSTFYSELWLTAAAAAVGDPVAYAQESQGRHIHDVFPTPGDADKLSSRSSSLALDYHTEMAFHPHSPDFVLLYALRQDPEKKVETRVSSVRRFIHELSPEQQSQLFKREFRAGIDYSFGSQSGTLGNGPLCSVFRGRADDPFLCVDDIMEAENPQGQEILNTLRQLIIDRSQAVILEAGSLLMVDDRRAAHSRTAFRAHFDGTDRWLQRLLVKRNRDLAAEDMLKGTSVIATDFSKYFEPESPRSGDGP